MDVMRFRALIGRTLALVLCGCLSGVLVAAIAFPFLAIWGVAAMSGADVVGALPGELIARRAPQASEVYAADNATLISRFFDDNRRDVPLTEVALPMQQAIIAAEDHSFYTHRGVDARAVARALVANWSGAERQGGSTLTMQYVRLTITYSATDPAEIVAATEDTNRRKLREVRLAQEVERRLTKQQILEGYLNMAPFGNGTFGVYTASQFYFGKPPADLAVFEAATLAAMVKNPTFYNPATPVGALRTRERRDWVIGQMVEIGAISAAAAVEAQAVPLAIKAVRGPDSCEVVDPNHWGYFCDFFYRWWLAQDAFGATPYERERRLKEGGYRIVTTLDPAIQDAARKRVEQRLKTGHRNALMVAAIEPGTGQVRALATNRTFKLNDPAHPNPRSSDPKAPPGTPASYPNTTNPLLTGGGDIAGYQAGSAFKIFTVVAALEKGYPLDYPINAPVVYESGYRGASGAAACPGSDRYCPRNDNPGMAGMHNIWTAFGRSVNTYFVPLEERVGAANVVDVARRLGIQFRASADRARADDPAAARAWGAFTLGVSATTPLDLANAYATLAADGRYCEPIPVLQILTRDGGQLPTAQPRCKQAVAPDVARAAVDAARCPVGDRSAFGECRGATADGVDNVVGHPVAGKTGTTDSHRSAALVAMTTTLAVAGILANPDWAETTDDMSHGVVNPAVYETLADAMRGKPKVDFPRPSRRIAYGDQREIPAVTCQPVGQATAALRRAGFQVAVDNDRVSSPCPPGAVAGTVPEDRAVLGGEVLIRVSRGP
jgi:membrane peptidoglycan carboxypeptidase